MENEIDKIIDEFKKNWEFKGFLNFDKLREDIKKLIIKNGISN